MTLYANMIPFFILTTLLGAMFMAYTFQKIRQSTTLGASIGALAGLVGPMLFMAPLQSCTFEPEREPLDFWLGVLLFLIGAGLILIIAQWISRYLLAQGAMRAELLPTESTVGKFRTSWIVPILLLAPTLVILLAFLYYPTFETFRLSTLLTRLGAPRSRFMCVNNFTELLNPHLSTPFIFFGLATVVVAGLMYWMRQTHNTHSDNYGRLKTLLGFGILASSYLFFMQLWSDDYRDVMYTTVIISSMIVVIGLTLSLAIAYLVFQPVTGASIYRTLLIWPYAISPPIAGILFFVMFDPTAGIVDHFLYSLTGTGLPNYRETEWLARGVVIMASVWKTLGYNILFYIAGLQNVSKELVEAAAIDGANAWQRFRNVVIPSLSPITFFLIITNLTYAFFDTYGTIDYLTRGAPAGATSNAIYEIIRVGVDSKDLGRGAAQSIVLFLIVIGITLWQFRTSGRRVNYGA